MSHKAWQNAHAMYENDACAKALGIDIISMDEGFALRDPLIISPKRNHV